MKDAALPITLIVVGVVWLVWYLGWMPDKDWVIGLGFIAGGIAVLVLDGFTRNSVVAARSCRHRAGAGSRTTSTASAGRSSCR